MMTDGRGGHTWMWRAPYNDRPGATQMGSMTEEWARELHRLLVDHLWLNRELIVETAAGFAGLHETQRAFLRNVDAIAALLARVGATAAAHGLTAYAAAHAPMYWRMLAELVRTGDSLAAPAYVQSARQMGELLAGVLPVQDRSALVAAAVQHHANNVEQARALGAGDYARSRAIFEADALQFRQLFEWYLRQLRGQPGAQAPPPPTPPGALAVGSAVRIVVAPHGGPGGPTVGTVAEVYPGPAYGLRFAGNPEVHRWYVGSELAPL